MKKIEKLKTKKQSDSPIETLKKRLVEVSRLASIFNMLAWDQEVNMPKKAADSRAASLADLSAIIHDKFIAIDRDGLLTKLTKEVEVKKIKGSDAVIVSETWRRYAREKKLPETFIREMAEVASKSQQIWALAREKNDFALFKPWLARIIALKRKEADYIGYIESPYDALIDVYEPGITAREASKILNDLKDFLVPFYKKIRASKAKKPDPRKLKGKFPLDAQKAFSTALITSLGFDFDAGRLDISTHPFASGLHPYDVRMTTRYDESDLFYSLGAAIHETGHGLYEQGLPAEHFGTPLGESVSHGIHESQSRMWENIIGKGRSFWKYFYPKLQKTFPKPFKSVPFADFYRIINCVNPSLIRVEADEVTYNLHIILRFEIEKELIEGSIDLDDLPEIWNAKMKEYIGITPTSNREGVLQDVHWSCGHIGYFPTYTFGNLYSAQFFDAMSKDIPDLEARISKGDFKTITTWLRKHIHSKGKISNASDLVVKVTGERLNSAYFCHYLERKYKQIYSLK